MGEWSRIFNFLIIKKNARNLDSKILKQGTNKLKLKLKNNEKNSKKFSIGCGDICNFVCGL